MCCVFINNHPISLHRGRGTKYNFSIASLIIGRQVMSNGYIKDKPIPSGFGSTMYVTDKGRKWLASARTGSSKFKMIPNRVGLAPICKWWIMVKKNVGTSQKWLSLNVCYFLWYVSAHKTYTIISFNTHVMYINIGVKHWIFKFRWVIVIFLILSMLNQCSLEFQKF